MLIYNFLLITVDSLDAIFPFSNKITGARYSDSLTIKSPFIPSKWRSSSTRGINSLQGEKTILYKKKYYP
ncbi:MAG: hypothetical protein ACJ71E_04095 [Nitrososphaeraceae archaeon]